MNKFQLCIVEGSRDGLSRKEIWESQKLPQYGGLKESQLGKFSSFCSKLSTGFSELENVVNRWELNGEIKTGIELCKELREPMAKIHTAAQKAGWLRHGTKIFLKRPHDMGKRGRTASAPQDYSALANELAEFVIETEDES